MSLPAERIQSDITRALKSGDRERVSVLRMLLAEIKNDAIRRGEEVDDDAFVALVRKAIKQRREAADQFERGGRDELAAKETREAGILEIYLPQQVDEDEVRRAIAETIAADGLAGPGAIGPLMKAMMARFRGTADGAMVNRLAREALAAIDTDA
jgi:uncharacterized protein YqeY